jgi:hypothetical protein
MSVSYIFAFLVLGDMVFELRASCLLDTLQLESQSCKPSHLKVTKLQALKTTQYQTENDLFYIISIAKNHEMSIKE